MDTKTKAKMRVGGFSSHSALSGGQAKVSNDAKRLLSVVMVILTMMVFTMTPVFATELYGAVTADVLNVRSEPNTSSAVLGQLVQGTVVAIIGLETGWAQITHSGNPGYVSTDYILMRTSSFSSRSGMHPPVNDTGADAVEYAKTFLGTPYRYGGSTPSGFDCSGFTSYVYKNFGVQLARVASDQRNSGEVIESKEDLLPGDLVFFWSKVGSSSISHVGIYAGNGQMIHSPYTGTQIRFDTITGGTYSARFAGGRRYF